LFNLLDSILLLLRKSGAKVPSGSAQVWTTTLFWCIICRSDQAARDKEGFKTPYQVKLEVFEGPLDLLLQLIEKRELDITKVSLAEVTDQYLGYISLLHELEAAALADFLVIAAKLLLIKSQMLLPQPPPLEEEEEDIGDELVRQLIEYKRFKEAAQELRQREEMGLRAYVRVALPPRLEPTLDLEGITLDDLLEAVQQAMAVTPVAPSVSNMVTPITVTIADKISQIEAALHRRSRVSFNRLLARAVSRVEVIVAFLAVLELIKRQRVDVQQERAFGEIIITAKVSQKAQN
jgi:segregation and condensation protein A